MYRLTAYNIMIVKNMSDSEILKELKTIDTILKSRISGHLKKFEKKLKSNAYKHNDVLEVREYVINWIKIFEKNKKYPNQKGQDIQY